MIANTSDWMGLYIDGVCVYQGHDIEPGHLLEILGIEHESRWVKNHGHLPKQINDVLWEKE